MTATDKSTNVRATEDELGAIQDAKRFFERGGAHGRPRLVTSDGESVELPESLYQVLVASAPRLLEERSVLISSLSEVLTTQEAADILNMSRQHLVNLLEDGEIPFHKIGSHRRLKLADVLTFKTRLYKKRRDALAEMAQIGQEAGMYRRSDEQSHEGP